MTLIAQIPSTLYGGVLADAVDRKALVATMMMVCAFTSALLAILCAAGALHPAIIYVAIAIVSNVAGLVADMLEKHWKWRSSTVRRLCNTCGMLGAGTFFFLLAAYLLEHQFPLARPGAVGEFNSGLRATVEQGAQIGRPSRFYLRIYIAS